MTREVADMVAPNLPATMQPKLEEGQKIMVAARGINPVLNFALEEAQLRKAVLCVLYVKEIAVYFSGAPAALGARNGRTIRRRARSCRSCSRKAKSAASACNRFTR